MLWSQTGVDQGRVEKILPRRSLLARPNRNGKIRPVAANIDNEIAGTLDLAAGGFKSLTRIASSPFSMWHDIYDTNRVATTEVLDKFIAELQNMRSDLQTLNLKIRRI